MTTTVRQDLQRIPILGDLSPGTTQHHEVTLPGEALSTDRWPVTTVAGSRLGPVVLLTAGVHGCEYPAIEAAIRLGRTVRHEDLGGAARNRAGGELAVVPPADPFCLSGRWPQPEPHVPR